MFEASNDKESLYFHSFTRYMEHFKVKSKSQQMKRYVSVLGDKKTHIVRHKSHFKKHYCGNQEVEELFLPVSYEGDRSEAIFSKLISVSEVIFFCKKRQCAKKTVHI